MEYSDDQLAALEKFKKWDSKKPFILGGYAGTGKTTLIKEMRGPNDYVVAYTNKAVAVLKAKGIPAQTIHSLIYQLVCEESMRFTKRGKIFASRILVDEASMIDESIRNDLESYKLPVVYVGDPFQLPPISGPSIMTKPTVCLEKIHRQAEGSPIIQLASKIRETGKWPHTLDRYEIDYSGYDIVICHKNITRYDINRLVRRSEGPPKPGDVVCLMRTCHDTTTAGGEIGTITSMYAPYRFTVDFSGREVTFNRAKFLARGQNPYDKTLKGRQVFDFGHAITCHKAQGSQFDKVLVVDEKQDARWMYTAVTRAITNVDIAG